MVNVTVPCYTCNGKKYEEIPNPVPFDPTQYYTIPCRTCEGYGVLVATELKAISKVRTVPNIPRDSGLGTK